MNAPVAEVRTAPGGLSLQATGMGPTPPLEVFVRKREPDEYHLYTRGLSFPDFAGVFEADLRGLEVLIFQMPPELLNPNYWEPYSRETEEEVRERRTGLLTRDENGKTSIWRSDQVPADRILRDGLDVKVELLLGFVFRLSGEGLIRLGRAAGTRTERFEWTAFPSLPAGEVPGATILTAHRDLTQMRLTLAEERILFAAEGDGTTRLLFAGRERFRRALSALLRGFLHRRTGTRAAAVGDRTLDQILRAADGFGFHAHPVHDFVDKDRTFEIRARLGGTAWGTAMIAGREPLSGDERLMIYYDRISGIWAVST